MDIEKYYDQVEAYLSKSMTPEEQGTFEGQMKVDKKLKRTVLNHVLANEAIGLPIEDRIARKLKNLETNRKKIAIPPTPQIAWKRWISVAASLLFFIFAGTLFWSNQTFSTQALANDFYETSTLPSIRSEGATNQQWNQGILAFSKNEYDKAITNLLEIPTTDLNYLEAQYILGHAYWQKGNYAKADSYFSSLLAQSNIPTSIDKQELEWNRLLSVLNNKGADSSEFKATLSTIKSNSNHPYYQQAQELSQKLNSFWRNFTLN